MPRLKADERRKQLLDSAAKCFAKDGYRGYSNAAEYKNRDGEPSYQPMNFLNTPDAPLTVPEHRYWAMGALPTMADGELARIEGKRGESA